ncbi:NACHT domain-containing protein [Nonomuraea fuscirosea]|uniref:NACHT domain-containing protein n=1 Tax=Nonomuraea fuscirosea TaxID=1291556 RepID=UPI0033F734E5
MARTISYLDAAKLLGAPEKRIVEVMDKLSGAALLTTATIAFLTGNVAGGALAIGLIDAKSVVMQLSQTLLSKLPAVSRKRNRYSKTELLTAAHAIIVVSAFFEIIEERSLRLPLHFSHLNLTREEQAALAADRSYQSKGKAQARALLEADIPIPGPHHAYEQTLEEIRRYYVSMARRLSVFITGLQIWDSLNETQRDRVVEALENRLPNLAIARYEELYRQLAAEYPEFFVWAAMQEHAATRSTMSNTSNAVIEELRSLKSMLADQKDGLTGLESLLIAASGDPTKAVHAGLNHIYHDDLERPLAESSSVDTHEGLRIPALGHGYVNPLYRVVEIEASARPAEDRWWKAQAVRENIQGFLAGYLTSLKATELPLIILGQPGSGKSVLTRVLAARLPEPDFLPIRVELRHVQANAPLQDQIEEAVYRATGTRSDWPAISNDGNGALPVVLLDGFDELLQSTKVSRSDYLEQVRDFQRREAQLGRPVAVIVTSRTVVADRARIPSGSACLRLEPFTDEQIHRWIQVWNTTNNDYFARNNTAPLNPRVALRNREIAAQPLLLMMLALYDADGNALSSIAEGIQQSDLYERLLAQFTRREVFKSQSALDDAQLEREVNRELMRLSVVAFAMFNRNKQTVSEGELDLDMLAIIGGSRGTEGPHLTPGQLLVGRFFFVHESLATLDESKLKVYEFLHATFGEYLVARFTIHALNDFCARATLARQSFTPSDSRGNGLLYALLSFSPLTMRAAIIDFLAELLSDRTKFGENSRSIVVAEFRDSLNESPDSSFASYSPLAHTVPARLAVYSANLLLLAILMGADGVRASELFVPNDGSSIDGWQSSSHLWRSQFTAEAWQSFVKALEIERIWSGTDERDLIIKMREGSARASRFNLAWSFAVPVVDQASSLVLPELGFDDVLQQPSFLVDPYGDVLADCVEGLASGMPELFSILVPVSNGTMSCAARSLIDLWYVACTRGSNDLKDQYFTCLAGVAASQSGVFLEMVLRQLELDSKRLSAYAVAAILDRVKDLEWIAIESLTHAERIATEKGRTEKHSDLMATIRSLRGLVSIKSRKD